MASELPDYIAASQPIPPGSRAAWFKNTAPAYAGIVLWFVFWQNVVIGGGQPGGVLAQGILPALIGLALAALLCHFLFYLVPGLLGVKTGRPLYVVGSSTYGARGGLFMPGFLMGLLQFGWIAVNASAVSTLLCRRLKLELLPTGDPQVPGLAHAGIAAAFVILGAFVGIKGIKYVGKVATFLPLIPLIVLIVLVCKTAGGLATFTPEKVIHAGVQPTAAPTRSEGAATPKAPTSAAATGPTTASAPAPAATKPTTATAPAAEKTVVPPADKGQTPLPLTTLGVIAMLCTYVVGFFATAGAAGVDMGMNNRNPRDVQLAGLAGVVLATIVAGGLAMLVVAGAYGGTSLTAASGGSLNPTKLLPDLLGQGNADLTLVLLAVSAFPPVCFSAFIAANSMKTTLPNVSPWLSIGCGTAAAIVLAVTGAASKVEVVFGVIGATFGPVCGAMAADYLLAGRKWSGPRAGFNPAGWISWIAGVAVGSADIIAKIPGLGGLEGVVPVPPVAAFLVGFVLYIILASMGLRTRVIKMPSAQPQE